MNPHKAPWLATGAAASAALLLWLLPALLGEPAGAPGCAACPDSAPVGPWARLLGGLLAGLLAVALASALLHPRAWRPFSDAGWAFVLVAVAVLSAGLSHGLEALAMWLPELRLASGAGPLTLGATGLAAASLFHLLTRPPAGALPHRIASLSGLHMAASPAAPPLASGGAPGCNRDRNGSGGGTPTVADAPGTACAALAEAERANRLKDTFLAMVSHELRTPLQSTLYWAELLRRDGAGPGLVAEAAQHIIHNVSVQSRLIEDLLDLSRILTGQLRLELQPADGGAVVRRAVEMVQTQAAARGVTVVFDAPAGPLLLMTDPCRLEQVAWNLISNAAQASCEGARVEVSVRSEGPGLRLCVTDHGVGIAPQDLPHLFEAFRQGSARTSRHGGLGLGLAITRNIVRQFGGDIVAASDGPGLGARFTVTLPLQPPAEWPEASAAVCPPCLPVPALQGLRLLYVEPRDDTARAAQAVLERLGARVERCSGFAPALERLPRGGFDALLCAPWLDAGHSGEDLVRALRAQPLTRSVPALTLSGCGARRSPPEGAADLFAGHLALPASNEAIAGAITGALRRAAPA
jgi:CheY-like chemotaxis protein